MSDEDSARLKAELAALQNAFEALAERERRLLDFTEASGDWFWEQDEKLRFTFVSVREPSHRARALTQRPCDQLLGRTRADHALREPGDEEAWAAHLADLAARRPFRDFVYRAKATQGPIWVRVSGVPVFGRDGRFRGYRGVGREVTAEVEAARASARAEALFRDTLDRLPVGISVFDGEKRLIWANRAYALDAGLDPDRLRPGLPLAELVRLLVAAGWYGDVADAEAAVAARLAIDRSQPLRWTRRHPASGRTFDIRSEPIPGGGHVVCSVDVTSIVEAEAQARREADRLDTVLSRLGTGVCVFGPDHRVVLANDRYARLVGLPSGFLKPGVRFAELLAVLKERGEFSNLDDPDAYVDELLGADRSVPRTRRRRRPDGAVLDLASVPLPDGGFMVSANDVTALAEAEAKAKARADLLQAILSALPHGVAVYGPDRRLAMVNPAYGQIMAGAPISVGESVADIVRRRAEAGEYGPGEVEEIIRRELARDITRPQRRRRVRPNGTAIDVRSAPLPDGGHISVVTDITPVVEAEAEAMRRAAVLNTMLEHIRHGICLFDRDRRIVAANRAAADLLGRSPDLLRPGRTLDELALLLDTREGRGGTSDGSLLAPAPSVPTVTWHHRPDGRMLELRSDPTPEGGFVLTWTDVTDQKAAESALRRAAEEAEAASRAKSQFLAAMSHELRTPLNAVIGFSEALAHPSVRTDPHRIEEYAAAINEAGRHLLALINDILDVACIEAGRLAIAEDTVDLARVAEAALRLLEPAARTAKVALTLALGCALPPVRGDERRLRQVLLNLLSNAVKFTHAGGSVRVEGDISADGGIELRVIDTGIGIAKADLERIFQPFTQVDSSLARRYPGSGLGLFLSRALISAHGGTLHLESEPGRGTKAVLRLPRDRVISEPTAPFVRAEPGG